MPDQACHVLAVLLDRAGNLVTRDELRQTLWPNGEFVEYDDAINRAISQLRSTLQDNSRVPRFIETIPKRGYRFIGDVRIICDNDDESQPSEIQTQPHSLIGEETATVSPEIAVPSACLPVGSPKPEADGFPFFRRRRWVIAGTVVLLLFVVGAAAIFSTYKRKSVAPPYICMGIAPLDPRGPDAEQFAESFRLDLTDALSQLPGVQVRAAHSFGKAKLDDAGIRGLARDLQLDVLLVGEFKIEGTTCAVQFELVRGRDAAHLASLQYQGSKDDLASIRDRVIRELHTRLELTRYASHPVQPRATTPRAYEAYLRARYYFLQQTDESLHKALEEFGAAITADPSFAKAYAGLASVHSAIGDHGLRPRDESYRAAKDLAIKAVEMDSSMAEAHAISGYMSLRLDWNFPEAEKEIRRAIELDPNQAIYHLWLSVLLCDQGRFDESFQQLDRAHAADPFFPSVYLTEAFVSSGARQDVRMVESGRKLVKMLPEWPLAHVELAWALWYAGRHEEAIREWQQAASLEHDKARLALEERGWAAYKRGGPRAYAEVRLEAIQSGSPWNHLEVDFVPAEWYAYAGKQDKALSALEDMVARRQPDVLHIAVNPAYKDLHRSPRFIALLGRIGLHLLPSYPGTTPVSRNQ